MRLFVAAVLVAAVAPPAPAQVAGPSVEVRVRSINDLFEKAEYVAGLAGQEDTVKGIRALVKNLSADGKGVEGIDPKRPFGAYAVVTPDVVDSTVVVMIPIADKDRFLTMLKERAGIEPEKAAGGALKVLLPIPMLSEPVYLRFANDYLYIGGKLADVDPKAVVGPKDFFAADDGAVASARLRLDRLPKEFKAVLATQFEHQLNERLRNRADGQSPAEKKLLKALSDVFSAGAKGLLDDAQDATFRLLIEAKTDELTLEFAVTPKAGSPLAKQFTALGTKTSVPAGIVATADPLARVNVAVAAADGQMKTLPKLVDDVIADLVAGGKGDVQEGDRRILAVLAPTLKAGTLDAAMSVSAPDAKGKHTLLAAVAIKDGKKVVELLKEFAPLLPAGEGVFTFDVATAGRFALHKLDLADADPQFAKLFGTKTVWLATADDTLAFSFEPDGAALKKGLAAKAVPCKVMAVELSAAKLLPVVNPDLKADELKAVLKDAFGNDAPSGKDTITVTVEGGAKLVVKATARGKAVQLFIAADELKRK